MMRSMRLRPFFLVLLAVLACGRSNGTQQDSLAAILPPGHVPITTPSGGTMLPAVTRALLDSGNTAFRVKDFQGALAYYHKAALSAPEHAAPWFGTYMVGKAINDTALADSALRMVRARAPEMQSHPATPSVPGTTPDFVTPGAPYSPHGTPPPARGKSSS